MSTHAIVQFKDEEGIVSVFKHSDGNPRWIGQHLKEALEYAWELPRFEANEFAAAFVTACKLAHKKIIDENTEWCLQQGHTPNHRTAGGEIRIVPRSDALAWQWAGDSQYRYLVESKKNQLTVTAWEIGEYGMLDGPMEWHQARIYRGDLDGLIAVEDNPRRRLKRWNPKPATPKCRKMSPRLVHI